MPRGNYTVQNGMDVETGKQAQRDSSYRACLHAMLIFIAICIILLVAAWPWNNHKVPSDKSSNITDPYSAAVKGGEDRGTTLRPTTLRPTSRHTKGSTTTAKSTTYAIERKPLFTVIAVEETDAPPVLTVATTRMTRRTTTATDAPPVVTVATTRTTRRTTTAVPVEEPIESNKGLGILPEEETTAQSDTSTTIPGEETGEDNDIVVIVPEPESTTQLETTTTMQDQATGVDNDILVVIPEVSTTTEVDTTTTQVDTTTPLVDMTTTMTGDDNPIASIQTTEDDNQETVTASVTTTETNFEVDVFNATSEDDDDARERYESSSPSTLTETENTDSSAIPESTTDAMPDATLSTFTSPGSGLVCDSSHCKALSTRILSLMNHSVDPCDDLYEHACGGLRSNPSLLGDDPSKDVYERIKRGLNNIVNSSCQAHKTFKRYYDSCVQFDAVVTQDQRIAEARRIIDKVGVFNDNDNPNPVLTDLTSHIIKLMQYHSTPLFDLMLDVDGRNPSQFALKLTAPVFKPMFRPFDRREDCLKTSHTMSDLNSFYHDYSTCKKTFHEIYLNELNDAINILKIPISNKTVTDINQHMEFELLGLMEHLPSAGEMQQALTGKHYVDMTITQLIADYPMVEWRTLTKALLKRDLPDDTHVQVYFKDYLHKMLGNFTDLDESKQQNLLLAYFAHDIYVDLVLTRDSCSREAYCLRVASDLMEEAASSLYLSTFKRQTLQDMRTEAQQVFSQLQRTLEHQLYDAGWLDEASKSAAVSKLKNLTLTVDGGIGVFLNETFLNDRMKDISQKDNNYITLSTSLLKRYRRQMYSLYDANPSDPQAMWSHFLLPHSTQGIVVYGLKNVVIPYGLMTGPMYEPALPRYLLMARLGFVIAHEMAHHFDVIGMTYGPNGRGDPLLSYVPNATFRDKTNCLKDTTSFEGTKVADNGRSITFKANESLSLNERIADRTAAALGYETYLAWVREHGEPAQMPYLGLTNNEVYFLAVAQIFCSKSTILDYGVSLFEDEHLPPFLRVNTIMDNSVEFTDVFQCKLGVDMNRNPDGKCEAFPKLTELETDFTPNDHY